MKTYRIVYRLGPKVGERKELLADAADLKEAAVLADSKLRLRYPNYRIDRIDVFGEAERASDAYREVEARR